MVDISVPDDNEFVVPICSIFRRFLKSQNLKFTSERAKILDVVISQSGVFEVDELLDEIRDAGLQVSRATVYRTIKHLIESGIIQEVLLDSKQSHYQLSYGKKQRDHMIHAETGEITEFHSPELDVIIDKICKDHDFQLTGHRLVIYGLPINELPPT